MPIRKNIAKKIIKIGTNGVKVVRKKLKKILKLQWKP